MFHTSVSRCKFVPGLRSSQAQRQVVDPDRARGRSDFIHRFQRSPAQPRASRTGDRDDQRNQAEKQESQQVERVVDGRERRTDLQLEHVVPNAELPLESPVRELPGDGDRLG